MNLGFPLVDLADEGTVASRVTIDQLIELMPGPFALLDRGLRIIRVNQGLETALGAPAGQLLGQPFLSFVSKQDQAAAARFLDAAQQGRASAELNLGQGRREPAQFALVATPIEHEGQPGVMLTGTDLREQRRMESQLIQARKGDAIGRLARGVAHDFNNTLAAVMSYAELILMDSAEDDPRRRDVTTIREAASRAAELTRQILVFSRGQAVQPRNVDLNALVLGLDKLLRRLIGEDIELATLLADDLPPVLADPGRLEADIVSHVVEARERLTVAPSSIVIQTLRAGDGVELVVANSDGPVATIALPRGQGSPPTAEQAPARGTETIILAEDNDMLRRGISAMLAQRGFTVHSGANGEDAIALARAHPEAKLLLADVVMPRMPASELDARVREARPDLKLVFMSGYAEDAVSRGIVKPAGFIQKPFSAEALARSVRDVLDAK